MILRYQGYSKAHKGEMRRQWPDQNKAQNCRILVLCISAILSSNKTGDNKQDMWLILFML